MSEVMGKMPPNAIDLEAGVIGAIMLEKNAIIQVADDLKPDVFYDAKHKLIYRAISELHRKQQPIDILTVTHQLRKFGELEAAGGPLYVSQLTDRVSSSANITTHSKIIVEKYILREMALLGSQVHAMAMDDMTDVFDVMDHHNREINRIYSENVKADAVSVKSLLKAMLSDVEDRNKGGSGGQLFSGISAVDNITSGWGRGELIVIGARPGMGKTAFILSCALNQAQRGEPVAIFSLEMTKLQILYRLASIVTGIDLETLSKKKLDDSRWIQLSQAIGKLESLPIFIDDTPGINIVDLRAKCMRLTQKEGIKCVYVDYLQLITIKLADNRSRENEVSEISKSLKVAAKECDIPVVALSQLSRQVEMRPVHDRRPKLSDLRESGSVEQDADQVAFLFRPEYYNITEDANGVSTSGIGEFIVTKNRNGGTGTAIMRFINYLAHYLDYIADTWTPTQKVRLEEHSDARSESIKPNDRWATSNEPAPF